MPVRTSKKNPLEVHVGLVSFAANLNLWRWNVLCTWCMALKIANTFISFARSPRLWLFFACPGPACLACLASFVVGDEIACTNNAFCLGNKHAQRQPTVVVARATPWGIEIVPTRDDSFACYIYMYCCVPGNNKIVFISVFILQTEYRGDTYFVSLYYGTISCTCTQQDQRLLEQRVFLGGKALYHMYDMIIIQSIPRRYVIEVLHTGVLL